MAQDAQQTEAMKQWGQAVARAWSDAAYKQRLLSDPRAVLGEAGLAVPPTVQVQVHEATPSHLHLVLPPRPPLEHLSDEQLEAVAGGKDNTDHNIVSKPTALLFVAPALLFIPPVEQSTS